MLNGLEENLENNIQHVNIPFVFHDNNNYFCTEHPEKQNMNLGAIKQHIRGKDHKLDWDTGMPLKPNQFSSIQEKQIFYQKLKMDEKTQKFLQTSFKLDVIFSSDNLIKSFILADHTLDEPLKTDVKNFIMTQFGLEN
jgi:hypothetical protein